MSDQLRGSQRFRALTIVDIFTRECLAITLGRYLRGEDVAVLEQITAKRDTLQKYDNGSEFSRPGKPTDNAYIEPFDGRLHEECLNAYWSSILDDPRSKLEAWQQDYNESRPHKALNN